jgi:hypothetical protein
MIAILLYLIGLISVIVTVVIVGYDGPAIYQGVVAAYNSGLDQVPPALARIAMGFSWALMPFLGGLLLMGFARIMMLLGAIRHALKGPA